MASRVVIGGIVAAAVIAGTTGAVAVAGPSNAPTPSSAATAKTTAGPGIAADPNVARVAAQLGVSADRLLQALPKAKMASAADGSLTGDAAARALAADLGVSPAQAQRALRELVGTAAPRSSGKSGTPMPPDQASAALAARLHVSTARAAEVLDALNRMADPGHGVDPASPAFAALAHSLGKTPAQLSQILVGWKQALRSTMPQSPSPPPATPSPAAS
jgi:hypothetical protein